MNELRAPERLRAAPSGTVLRFSQNGQRGVDGRRDGSAAHGQANGLRELAERDALGRRKAADQFVNRPAPTSPASCSSAAAASASSARTSAVTCLRTAFSS